MRVLIPANEGLTAAPDLEKYFDQYRRNIVGIDAKIEKISDIQEIMKYTISTPGLVINGRLRHSGKPLPSLEKVKELLKAEA